MAEKTTSDLARELEERNTIIKRTYADDTYTKAQAQGIEVNLPLTERAYREKMVMLRDYKSSFKNPLSLKGDKAIAVQTSYKLEKTIFKGYTDSVELLTQIIEYLETGLIPLEIVRKYLKIIKLFVGFVTNEQTAFIKVLAESLKIILKDIQKLGIYMLPVPLQQGGYGAFLKYVQENLKDTVAYTNISAEEVTDDYVKFVDTAVLISAGASATDLLTLAEGVGLEKDPDSLLRRTTPQHSTPSKTTEDGKKIKKEYEASPKDPASEKQKAQIQQGSSGTTYNILGKMTRPKFSSSSTVHLKVLFAHSAHAAAIQHILNMWNSLFGIDAGLDQGINIDSINLELVPPAADIGKEGGYQSSNYHQVGLSWKLKYASVAQGQAAFLLEAFRYLDLRPTKDGRQKLLDDKEKKENIEFLEGQQQAFPIVRGIQIFRRTSLQKHITNISDSTVRLFSDEMFVHKGGVPTTPTKTDVGPLVPASKAYDFTSSMTARREELIKELDEYNKNESMFKDGVCTIAFPFGVGPSGLRFLEKVSLGAYGIYSDELKNSEKDIIEELKKGSEISKETPWIEYGVRLVFDSTPQVNKISYSKFTVKRILIKSQKNISVNEKSPKGKWYYLGLYQLWGDYWDRGVGYVDRAIKELTTVLDRASKAIISLIDYIDELIQIRIETIKEISAQLKILRDLLAATTELLDLQVAIKGTDAIIPTLSTATGLEHVGKYEYVTGLVFVSGYPSSVPFTVDFLDDKIQVAEPLLTPYCDIETTTYRLVELRNKLREAKTILENKRSFLSSVTPGESLSQGVSQTDIQDTIAIINNLLPILDSMEKMSQRILELIVDLKPENMSYLTPEEYQQTKEICEALNSFDQTKAGTMIGTIGNINSATNLTDIISSINKFDSQARELNEGLSYALNDLLVAQANRLDPIDEFTDEIEKITNEISKLPDPKISDLENPKGLDLKTELAAKAILRLKGRNEDFTAEKIEALNTAASLEPDTTLSEAIKPLADSEVERDLEDRTIQGNYVVLSNEIPNNITLDDEEASVNIEPDNTFVDTTDTSHSVDLEKPNEPIDVK